MSDRWADRLRMPRTCTSAALLTELAGEHGVPARVCLRGTGITEAMLRDPNSEIVARQELRLLENLVAELGHVPALGLTAGQRYHATTHGVWGFAVISSPTVGAALDVAVRYFELSFSFADIRKEDIGDGIRLVLDDSWLPEDVRRFHTERDVAGVATIQRDLLNVTLPLREFEVALPEPAYADRYTELVGTTPRFSAAITSITVDRAVLDLPLPQANPHTAEVCAAQCADLLQRRKQRLGTSGQVRDLLLRRRGVAEQEEIAAELHLSVRTLRRRLADEGTSYRELAAETATMLAEELLGAGLSVEDVAHRLGYSTASAFTHAFKRHKDITPGRYARAGRQ
ncbi:AraC family transcriptional regulator [Herbihabitans rhizosphaerae]|uniref:AraC family transcriptional regulator n=1 Tax=Herbihabitans rhizosphaerae TaxID=1872711 RepID=A0A4Q7L2V7_9PSEU|nr:AraC family transcriptional regulator [Herbihabitans rhizosphaerae]RZS43494.1 AraC family transcriptional regulator [Herbihabitans rhizosphaerae]